MIELGFQLGLTNRFNCKLIKIGHFYWFIDWIAYWGGIELIELTYNWLNWPIIDWIGGIELPIGGHFYWKIDIFWQKSRNFDRPRGVPCKFTFLGFWPGGCRDFFRVFRVSLFLGGRFGGVWGGHFYWFFIEFLLIFWLNLLNFYWFFD